MSSKLAIVAGFGVVGRAVVESLEARGFRVTIIETNEKVVARQPEGPRRFLVGSACQSDTLRKAGLPEADCLVLTMPDEGDAVAAAGLADSIHSACFIVARTNFVSQGLLARKLGADAVVVEEIATAEAMAKLVGEHADNNR